MLNCIKYEITQLYMLFLTRTTAAMHSVENSGRIFLNILQNLSFFFNCFLFKQTFTYFNSVSVANFTWFDFCILNKIIYKET